MKNHLILILLILFIKSNSIFKNNKKSYTSILRNLWEEDMIYHTRNITDELESYEICEKSNYKYFSFILNGAPVSFEHYISQDHAVSKNKYILLYYKISNL